MIAACEVLAFHELVAMNSFLRQLPRHGNSSMGQRAMGLIRGSNKILLFCNAYIACCELNESFSCANTNAVAHPVWGVNSQPNQFATPTQQ